MGELHGVLLVDKPAGPTSQTAVTQVRRALGSDKAGHTGTLDPFATGLLVVCLGRATKLAGYLTVEDKEYRATVALGAATDTDDATGKEIARTDASGVTREKFEAALVNFRGPIRQVPPDFSAIQKDGERMYDRARRGEEVKIEPRDVVVHTLNLVSFTSGATPTAEIDLHVSKGTYIRSIARDLGAALGVGGHLTALRRTAAGALNVTDAIGLDAVVADPGAAALRLLGLDRVPLPFENLLVTADEAAKVAHGIAPVASARAATGEGLRAVRAPDGALLAIATLTGGVLRFERVI